MDSIEKIKTSSHEIKEEIKTFSVEQVEKIKKLKSEENKKKIKREFRKKMVGYIIAALGLIASLAWNDAMKAVVEHVFPNRKDTVLASFIYAIFVTLIVVANSFYLSHLFEEEGDRDVSEEKK